MLVPITNDPRPYAWGDVGAISGLLGREPTGLPEAELWLGAHPSSPARILDPAQVGGHGDLHAWIAADPVAALGPALAPGGRLPFLLKVLAAASPLSLQAHPNREQAAAGFAREQRAGIPIDGPGRSYRDSNHKPELIVALSERFEALCGFRPQTERREILDELWRLTVRAPAPRPDLLGMLELRLGAADPLRETVSWLLGGSPAVAQLVGHIADLARLVASDPKSDPTGALATVRELEVQYPGDPGQLVAMLVQRVTLGYGEALYLPAGNIHAYLHGLGVELMASSDNVLRGGLTPKHVDVPELLTVLDVQPLPVPFLTPIEQIPGVRVFTPDVPDFVLVHVHLDDAIVELPIEGPAIVLCIRGSADVLGATNRSTIVRGGALYVTPNEGPLTLGGEGELFVATTGPYLNRSGGSSERRARD